MSEFEIGQCFMCVCNLARPAMQRQSAIRQLRFKNTDQAASRHGSLSTHNCMRLLLHPSAGTCDSTFRSSSE